MSWGAKIRMLVGVAAVVVGLTWVRHTAMDPSRANLYVTAAICAVTAIYALFTYEIVLQNQSIARAAMHSAELMEQTLRFSFAPNLLYKTISTRDPRLLFLSGCVPVNNEDYQRAMNEYGQGGDQKEFVFGIVQNVGRGAATNLNVRAKYEISDSSSGTKDFFVDKRALVPLLGQDKSIALCVCVVKIPTSGDRVRIVSADLVASDFYLDAVHRPPQTISIGPEEHHVEPENGSVVQLA